MASMTSLLVYSLHDVVFNCSRYGVENIESCQMTSGDLPCSGTHKMIVLQTVVPLIQSCMQSLNSISVIMQFIVKGCGILSMFYLISQLSRASL